jgi:nicotinate-nucleotide--dimethylbenzimidazole phosphoribosyltransferase
MISHTNLISAKIGMGTQSFARPSHERHGTAIVQNKGQEVVKTIAKTGCNCIGFGEIGNTATASVLMSIILALPLPIA